MMAAGRGLAAAPGGDRGPRHAAAHAASVTGPIPGVGAVLRKAKVAGSQFLNGIFTDFFLGVF